MQSTPITKRIGYLSSEYPCVSHTFIRREILGLEELGYEVTRLALSPGQNLVDKADLAELKQTLFLKKPIALRNAIRQILVGLRIAGFKIFKGFSKATKMGRISDRGLLRHYAYLIEAIILVALAKQERLEHVHVHFGNNAAAIALLAKTLGGPKYSLMVHGPLEFDGPISMSLGEKVMNAEFTTAITSYCSAQIKRWVPYAYWPDIHQIHCTVGQEWFDAAVPVIAGQHDIVCVGRLGNEKGQILLVDAFAEAVNKGHRGNLYLIGDGEMRPVIENRIKELELAQRIFLTGWCSGEEIRTRLLSSRALVLASFAEGLPVVIMESMALMRPVISTSITGIPELVRHGENGWLTIAGDQAALTERLLEVDEMAVEIIQEMGKTAHEDVAADHSTQKEVAKLEALFSSTKRNQNSAVSL
ncbi:MAG: glycosyltransferase family 4 protein [Pseudomonadaceae bacterium]|nr:glycosyltransferase family 4 protein [Pseudomonadaceae bacterium]